MDATFKTETPNLPVATAEIPMVVQLARAELDQAVTTAKAYPRSMQLAMVNILGLATLDEKTAAECVYALPRGGKPIRGPSVRLAEIIASQWGNCKIGSRVVGVDRHEKVVIAEGIFQDLETGMTRVAQVQRRIVDSKGRLFNDDMIIVTGNAACSVAMREAILKGVPKAIWRRAYDAAEAVISGDIKTLVERRADMVKAYHAWGVTQEQLFACLEVAGMDDIGLDELGTLRAIYGAIKDREATVEDYFPPATKDTKAEDAARVAAKARSDKAAAPKADAKPPAKKTDQEQPKEEVKPVEDKGPQDPPIARREPEAEAKTATEDPVNDLFNTDIDRDGTAADQSDDTNILDTPFARQVIEDANGFGAEAARATHGAQITAMTDTDPGFVAALQEALDTIGG